MIGVTATKVVQINSECGRGSTGKIAVAISKVLESRGIENYIFYSGNHKSNYKHGVRIAGKFSVRIHQVLSRIFGDQGFHSSVATRRLIKKLKDISPDIILLHNIHGYYLNIELLFRFLKVYGKPVYWTLHDCWAFTGHCTHFTIAQCDKWKNGCGNCPQKMAYPYSWFFDRSNGLYKKKRELLCSVDGMTIISPSVWLVDKLKQSFLEECRIEVINNGIDLEVFRPTESDLRHRYKLCNKTVLLGVSSVWNYSKGLDVFIELCKRLDDSKYQIILVGTDDKIDEVLPSGIISVHRTQNQKELAQYYTMADVFVNPTREDNYPTVNMEAIACGTPVVAFDTGGCAEIIGDSCGTIVHSATVEELIEKIDAVLRNKEEYEENCRRESGKFAESRCFDNYVRLLCN